jgi:flagellar protein FlgJ
MGVGRTPADASQSLALDANALAGLRRQARESPEQALSKAAGQFEALFLNMVLKQMRESLPKDGPLDSDTMRTYTSMFDQQISQHLSSRGIGLRDALERQLAKRMGSGDAPKSANPAAITTRSDPTRSTAPSTSASKPVATSETPAPTSPGVASRIQSFIENLRPHAEKAATTRGTTP